MNIRDAADVLKDTLTAEDVVRMYGYTPQHGVIVCPFHGDKDASLHLYPGARGWCCFGCHKGGTVIDWVMLMEDVGFTDAVRILDTRAGTGLLDRVELSNQHRLRRAKLDAVKHAMVKAWDTVQDLAEKEAILLTRVTADLQAIPREMWSGRDWMTWGSANERLEELEDIIRQAYISREEVKAWRTTPQPTAATATIATTTSSPARASSPSPALSRMREKLADAQNKVLAGG